MMDVRPLRNEQDYDWAIREISRYFEVEPAPGTPDGDRFEVLSSLIKAYEDNHYAITHGDPVDVLHFAIESMGRSQGRIGGFDRTQSGVRDFESRSSTDVGDDPHHQQGMEHSNWCSDSSI